MAKYFVIPTSAVFIWLNSTYFNLDISDYLLTFTQISFMFICVSLVITNHTTDKLERIIAWIKEKYPLDDYKPHLKRANFIINEIKQNVLWIFASICIIILLDKILRIDWIVLDSLYIMLVFWSFWAMWDIVLAYFRLCDYTYQNA